MGIFQDYEPGEELDFIINREIPRLGIREDNHLLSDEISGYSSEMHTVLKYTSAMYTTLSSIYELYTENSMTINNPASSKEDISKLTGDMGRLLIEFNMMGSYALKHTISAIIHMKLTSTALHSMVGKRMEDLNIKDSIFFAKNPLRTLMAFAKHIHIYELSIPQTWNHGVDIYRTIPLEISKKENPAGNRLHDDFLMFFKIMQADILNSYHLTLQIWADHQETWHGNNKVLYEASTRDRMLDSAMFVLVLLDYFGFTYESLTDNYIKTLK